MRIRSVSVLMAGFVLGACSAVVNDSSDSRQDQELSEAVAALAAPDQNLASARLRSSDGCYWYRHSGPVETTELPLRTVDGQHICMQTTT